jgi:hypothetical protein
MMVVTAQLLHHVVVPLVALVALALPVAVPVVTTLLARMIVVTATATMIAATEVTEVIVLAALMRGQILVSHYFNHLLISFIEIVMLRKNVTVTKSARMEPAEKTAPGKVNLFFRHILRTKLADTQMAVAMESPPTHDELDVAAE